MNSNLYNNLANNEIMITTARGIYGNLKLDKYDNNIKFNTIYPKKLFGKTLISKNCSAYKYIRIKMPSQKILAPYPNYKSYYTEYILYGNHSVIKSKKTKFSSATIYFRNIFDKLYEVHTFGNGTQIDNIKLGYNIQATIRAVDDYGLDISISKDNNKEISIKEILEITIRFELLLTTLCPNPIRHTGIILQTNVRDTSPRIDSILNSSPNKQIKLEFNPLMPLDKKEQAYVSFDIRPILTATKIKDMFTNSLNKDLSICEKWMALIYKMDFVKVYEDELWAIFTIIDSLYDSLIPDTKKAGQYSRAYTNLMKKIDKIPNLTKNDKKVVEWLTEKNRIKKQYIDKRLYSHKMEKVFEDVEKNKTKLRRYAKISNTLRNKVMHSGILHEEEDKKNMNDRDYTDWLKEKTQQSIIEYLSDN